MEGLGVGCDALMDRLQSELSGANFARKTSTTFGSSAQDNVSAASHRPLIPPSQYNVSRYVGYPSPPNPFSVKREASPTISDSSLRTVGSYTKEVTMHEAATSPGPSVTGPPPRIPSPANSFSTDVTRMPDVPPRSRGHRRAQSEIDFRVPNEASFEADHGSHSPEVATISDDVGGDLFNMYIDMEKINTYKQSANNLPIASSRPESRSIPYPSSHHVRSISVDEVLGQLNKEKGSSLAGGNNPSTEGRVRHHHSNSMDGSTSFKHDILLADLEGSESKKTLAANKLAELALLDPKKAKRILANRQSAARSKERKTRYISELERRVQMLQTEATALSAQLTMLQRDTTGLTTENNGLKLRLQSMEQQAQLRDALNEALKDEVRRLRLATGQLANSTVMGNQQLSQFLPYTQPSNMLMTQQLQQYQQTQVFLNNQQCTSQQQVRMDFLQHNAFGSLQGLDGGLAGSGSKSEVSTATLSQGSNSSF
ncbi:hypothetical protein O6H91_08G028700 [Diphasiastrum complanatum]|uniref:Uncharacterized protein n=2 Tax=Diphasiastrum complanatum TaxID=34168 RepID=A0ACC2CVY4_DIPCM|nr:hypothetical protein O6H91_08G028700 [Diphasiastrum complanatum]KAJ7546180.1 hypothetical protein O6H91_08G028700 [Diphasiastrum complanatum]